MTVYWDIMFLINFTVDYLILYSTSKVNFLNTSFVKILLGAFMGGVYGIFVFEKSRFLNIILYFLVTFLMIYTVFSKIEFKTVVTFYIISFIFGGISNFLNNLCGVISMSDGFFYLENNLLAVLLGIVLGAFFVILTLKLLKRGVIKKRQIKVFEIFMEGKSISVAGLLDTGNLLLDPITLYPVILVDYDKIKELVCDELAGFLKEGRDLSYSLSRRFTDKIRLIPYKNSSTNDILKGFKPDYIKIKDKEEKIIKDVIIAVTYKKMSENNEFNAILNPQL